MTGSSRCPARPLPAGTVRACSVGSSSRCWPASLLSLAYEPVAVAYVMPLAVAGFALTTRGVRPRQGFVIGLVFGVAFYYVHIWWMKSSIGLAPWAGLAGIEALFYGLVGAASPVLQRLRAWPFWLAGTWTTAEIVRSEWPFSGMPWGRLGFGVVDTPIAPTLAYLGINGVSFLVAGIGFLVARFLLVARTQGDERLLAAAGVVLVVAAAVAPVVAPYSLDTTGTTTVAVVQGDVPAPANDILVDPRTGHPEPRRRHRRARPGRRRRGQAGARLRALAGELHGDRPVRGRLHQRPDRARSLRHRRTDPDRRHRRRRPRQRAQPGCGLGPGRGRGGAVHQAAPGGVRRVHPLPRAAVGALRPARPDSARHAQRHAQGSVAESPGSTSPTPSASTSPTTTAWPTRSSAVPSC